MKKVVLCLTALVLLLALGLAACGAPDSPAPDAQDVRTYWGTLSGTVTENGAPLGGVSVTAGQEKATTDEDGRYTIAVYDDGATVVFEKEGCIPQRKTFKSSSFYRDEISYDFIMFISTRVEGIVTAGGVPVAGAAVKIGLQETVTDADGKFVFERVIGTSMILTVTHAGKTARKPLYTDEMRTGAVEVAVEMEAL